MKSPLNSNLLTRRNALLALGTLSAAAMSGSVLAQAAYPSKALKMILGFPAGGPTDNIARLLALKLGELLGQPVVIENRPGANAVLAADAVSRSNADGYTLLYNTSSFALSAALSPKLPYNPTRDLTGVALTASAPTVLIVNNDFKANNIKEFIEFVKKNPGKLNYGSAGSGTSHHLAGELFKQQTQTFITHIPYRGAGPALQDLIGGNVDMMFDGLGSSSGHIKGGRIKPLMVAGRARNPAFPDVPSALELGLPDYDVTTWYGVWAPKGTPADVQAKAIETLRAACATPESKQIWASQGAEFADLQSAAFGSFVQLEIGKWAKVVKAAGGVTID